MFYKGFTVSETNYPGETLITDADFAPSQAPVKGWRNKWWHEMPVTYGSGESYPAGERWGKSFPNRQEAERRAHEICHLYRDWCEHTGTVWLGAFPVEGDA